MITTVENYIGVMSGSSLDGLDIAMISLTLDPQSNIVSWRLEKSTTEAFDQDIKERLRFMHGLSALDYFKLESDFSQWVGNKIYAFANMEEVNAIGFHGHTLTHQPDDNYSIQMGNGGIISSITHTDTVTDFRIQDILKGGTGAPIVPAVEMALFSGYDYYLNLGGIANMTLINKKQAYDICPCNQVLNHLAQQVGQEYDDEGQMARNGKVDQKLLLALSQIEYYHLSPPKSIDNQWIKEEIFPLYSDIHIHDGLATAVESMASLIAAITTEPGRLLITGGGALNNFLIERITEKLKSKDIEVILPEIKIIESKEAILMAYMAYARIHHKVNVHREFTGSKENSTAGAYYKST